MLTKLLTKPKTLINSICALAVVFLFFWGINLRKQNEKLTASLEMAQNNVEAYLGVISDSQLANNVLKLDIELLSQQNDKLINELDSVREVLNIKSKELTTAATQTQKVLVTLSKGVGGDLIQILNDTTYNDSIKYNDLTTVYYTIGIDTVSISLDIKNTQYLFLYTKRQYKNKKNFFKRLLTFDFKKINVYKYKIVNTNELFNTEDVRIIESTNK